MHPLTMVMGQRRSGGGGGIRGVLREKVPRDNTSLPLVPLGKGEKGKEGMGFGD
jgi:hypothetical protein